MAMNAQFHGRTKHVNIHHYFVWDKVHDGAIEEKYCRSDQMLADMLRDYQEQCSRLKEMAGIVSICPSLSV